MMLAVVRDVAIGVQVSGTIVVAVGAIVMVVWIVSWVWNNHIVGGLLYNKAVRRLQWQRQWPRWSEIRPGRPGVPMSDVFPPNVRSHRPHGRHELHREVLAIEPPAVVDPVAVVAAEPEPTGRHFGPHWMAPTGIHQTVYAGKHFGKDEQVTHA